MPIIAAGAGERFQFQSAHAERSKKALALYAARTRAILIRPPGKTLEREEDEWPAASSRRVFSLSHSALTLFLQKVAVRWRRRAGGEPIFFSPEKIVAVLFLCSSHFIILYFTGPFNLNQSFKMHEL